MGEWNWATGNVTIVDLTTVLNLHINHPQQVDAPYKKSGLEFDVSDLFPIESL